MAATDTFEWFVSTALAKHLTPELTRVVRDRRAYLHTLRSEDERQRFVASVMEELGKREREGGG